MSSAILSPCGTYRYVLKRRIPSILRWVRPVLWIMLNPSVADASTDDPTIRRCLGFSKAWGCTEMTVVNLFALRATDPKQLLGHANPIGPDNDDHVHQQIDEHRIGLVVLAWGAHKMVRSRGEIRIRCNGFDCLGTSMSGEPRHPLYVAANTDRMAWEMPA